jgi:hypothetical protein
MTLETSQHAFWRAMRDPAPPPDIEACFRGDARLSARERLLIYRRAYWTRQIEALRDEFRRLAKRLAPADFSALMHEYLMTRPSPDPRIEWVGGGLAAFLAAHPAEERRRLSDLAAYEWAEVEALLAEDAPQVTTTVDVAPGVFPSCSLAMVPALRVLALVTDPLVEPAGAPMPTVFAVWRQGFSVRHRRLDSDEHHAAVMTLGGAPLASVCEAFSTHAEPERRAAAVLSDWLVSGWISRVVPPARDVEG